MHISNLFIYISIKFEKKIYKKCQKKMKNKRK